MVSGPAGSVLQPDTGEGRSLLGRGGAGDLGIDERKGALPIAAPQGELARPLPRLVERRSGLEAALPCGLRALVAHGFERSRNREQLFDPFFRCGDAVCQEPVHGEPCRPLVIALQESKKTLGYRELHRGLLQKPVELFDGEMPRRLLLGQLGSLDKPLHRRLWRGESALLHLAELQQERSAGLRTDNSGEPFERETVESRPVAERTGEAAPVGEQLVAKGPGRALNRSI